MSSEREQTANRIAEWLQEHDQFFSNVQQTFVGRDDGRPGGGYSVTFRFNEVDYQLVVWNEKRIDFHMGHNPPEMWTRFDSEETFYSFAATAWNIQLGPIKHVGND